MVAIDPIQEGFEPVEENLRAALAVFSAVKETGEMREMPGVLIISSGLTVPMFNAAFHLPPPSGAPEDLERRIALAGVHFGARGLRWCYWLCEDRLERPALHRTREIFGKHGMHLAMASPGMVAGRLPQPDRPFPALECRRVSDEASRLAFAHIMSVAFGIPFAVATEVYGSESIWRTGFAGYVGYLDGDPVSTTATIIAAGVIGIYAVGTLPGYQRRGYAETVMRYAVERAREESGIERTILQSSQAGLPLYLKLGYKKVTEFQVFVSPS
jgi:GNAT superfamily N-acetyltransferase